MGHWNETDMLCQLPIFEGETVYAVILALRRGWTPRRTSLPNEEWAPISPLLLGQYDGYGGVRGIVGGDALAEQYTRMAQEGVATFSDHTAGNVTMSSILSVEDLVGPIAEPRSLVTLCSAGHEAEQVQLAFIRPEICAFATTAVEQMASEEGFSLDELGNTAFEYTHPLVNELRRRGIDVLPVLRLNLALRVLRLQWHPQSGAGNQDGIEHSWQVNFYKSVAALAETLQNRSAAK